MKMAVMEELPTRTNGALGTVWIKSDASSLHTVGLENALKTRGISVHRGLEPPLFIPSVVVYPPTDDENIAPAVKEIKELAPDAAIVVFGASAKLPLARAAVRAGADGFLHAGMPPKQIARALHKAQSGHEVLPRELLRELVAEMVAEERESDFPRLSSRKVEILEMVAEGLSNAQIAKRLYVSESTVKQHLRSAYKALGVKNRNQAASLMLRGSDPKRVAGRESLRNV
jgi:DNA-binding NarL/FixJ family response regulator